MNKAPRTLVPLVVGLLTLSTLGAGEGVSRLDGRWQTWYTKGNFKSYEMEFSGDRFQAVDGEQWYEGEVVIDSETTALVPLPP